MRIVHWHIWLPEGNRLQETCCRKKQLCLPCLKYLYLYCSCRLSLHQILIKRFLDQNFDYTRRNINKNYPWSIMHHNWLVVYLPLWKIWKSVMMKISQVFLESRNPFMFQSPPTRFSLGRALPRATRHRYGGVQMRPHQEGLVWLTTGHKDRHGGITVSKRGAFKGI